MHAKQLPGACKACSDTVPNCPQDGPPAASRSGMCKHILNAKVDMHAKKAIVQLSGLDWRKGAQVVTRGGYISMSMSTRLDFPRT